MMDSSTSSSNNQKRLTKMSSMMSIGSAYRDPAARSIRSIRDDAIETMVVGVNWAASCDDNELDNYQQEESKQQQSRRQSRSSQDHQQQRQQPEDTSSSSTTIPMGSNSRTTTDLNNNNNNIPNIPTNDSTILAEEAPDLEQAAAAAVAAILRASQRRRSSTTIPSTPSMRSVQVSAAPRLLVRAESPRDEPLPRATKSTPCRSWRLGLMNLLGVTFIVGGIGWATWQYLEAPRYASVETGLPVAAVVCSDSANEGSNNNNATTTVPNQQALVEEACRGLEDWKRPCTFAIFYTFVLDDDDNDSNSDDVTASNKTTAMATTSVVYSGVDTWQFDDASTHQCHTTLAESRTSYLTQTSVTIHYQTDDPARANQYTEPTLQPHTMAAIIAAISCGLGLLFLCSSLLECVC